MTCYNMVTSKCVLLLLGFVAHVGAQDILLQVPEPSEAYPHYVDLDELQRYHLFWKFDDTSITFEVHARTAGWVGLGFSSAGAMAGSDMVVGGVKDGQPYFKDRHATGNTKPQVDESQDYSLVSASEVGPYTVLKFTRLLETCDDHDWHIEDGTIRVIFSWGQEDGDPDNDIFEYHGATQRGSKSLTLLDFGNPAIMEDIPDPDDLQSFDLMINNVALVNNKRTVYGCRVQRLPMLTEKHHVVKIEPVIEPKNLGIVHHIVLYMCHIDVADTVDRTAPRPNICWENEMPENVTACDSVLWAWGVGAGIFHAPKEAGFSIGGPGDYKYINIEVHYDNPQKLQDVSDNSGMRIHFTKKLRPNDAGTMVVGHNLFPLAIPSKADNFVIEAPCSGKCTSKLIPPGGINAFAVFLHTHLAGVAVGTRHFRNGMELPPLSVDEHYDFNYQQTRLLKKHVNILPGDDLLTRCVYRTTDRTKTTFGGPGSDNEMCLNFFSYYPRIGQVTCMASIQSYFMMQQLITEKAMLGEFKIDAKDNGSTIDHLKNMPWNEDDRKRFESAGLNSRGYLEACAAAGNGVSAFRGSTYYVKREPLYRTAYVKPTSCKQTRDDGMASGAGAVTSITTLVAVLGLKMLCTF